MPSFTIHLSIAKEYMKKHPGEIHNEEEFYYGNIAPDLTKLKSETHYRRSDNLGHINFKQYLKNQYEACDFEKGYLLHLLSDEIFYQVEYGEEYKEIIKVDGNLYDEYDYINKELKEKYNITYYPEEIAYFLSDKEGSPEFLQIDRLENFISKVSDVKLDEQIKHLRNRHRVKYDLDKDNLSYKEYHKFRTIYDLFNKSNNKIIRK